MASTAVMACWSPFSAIWPSIFHRCVPVTRILVLETGTHGGDGVLVPLLCNFAQHIHRCLPDTQILILEAGTHGGDGGLVTLLCNLAQHFHRCHPDIHSHGGDGMPVTLCNLAHVLEVSTHGLLVAIIQQWPAGHPDLWFGKGASSRVCVPIL